jgi:hypothetical protein
MKEKMEKYFIYEEYQNESEFEEDNDELLVDTIYQEERYKI